MTWPMIELVLQVGTIVLSAWFGVAFLRAGLRLRLRRLVYASAAYAAFIVGTLLDIFLPGSLGSGWPIIVLVVIILIARRTPPTDSVLHRQGISTWDLLFFRV